MALVIRELYKNYFIYVENKRDTRVDNYFLMGPPWQLGSLLLLYFYFVKSLGPKLMENRKPFDLKQILLIYNAFQVISNLIIATVGLNMLLFKYEYDFSCMLPDYSFTEKGYYESNLSYSYFALKVIDLLDTIFFILRKRYNQITFLHVYHHIGICFGAYIGTKYVPAGHHSLLGVINTYVHVIMYGYYFLTALKTDLKTSVWKKYITQLQIAQFTILVLHYLRPLIGSNCQYPKIWLILGVIQNSFMLILFSDFYIKAYIKKKKNN